MDKSHSKKGEVEIPELVRTATSAAYRRAVKTGSVVIYKDGEIRRIESDGKNVLIKKMDRRGRIPKGSKFEIEPV